MQPLADRDLNHVLDHTRDFWEDLRGERIFITGGTGFFGCWLLESFLWANTQLKLNSKAFVLSRSPLSFLNRMPHLKERPELNWVQGDIVDFEFPEGRFPYIIHAATDSSAKLNKDNPDKMFETIVEGTKHAIEFAQARAAKKFLLTSSGAVYGKQPADMDHIPEEYQGAPNTLDPFSAYAEGKRTAETLCALSATSNTCEMKIARCFAFVGPHLPLDAHFAIGNFIRDAMQGGPIVIRGDGTPLRSYLYVSDLTIWLWTLLFKGQHLRPYNIGSDESISIAELANLVAKTTPGSAEVKILQKPVIGAAREKYVPSIDRVKAEFNINDRVSLENAILNTEAWLQN